MKRAPGNSEWAYSVENKGAEKTITKFQLIINN